MTGDLHFVSNVKEHATLSAWAHVDHGVEVGITEEHVNRAADRCCSVSTCSGSFVYGEEAVLLNANTTDLMPRMSNKIPTIPVGKIQVLMPGSPPSVQYK